MNFQGHLESVFHMVKSNALVLILGGLLIQILVGLTLGVLAGPLLGGYILLMVFYFRENRVPTFNDLFSGMSRFWALFPYILLLLLVFCGILAFVIPGIIFAVWWMYALPLMVDKDMGLGDAMRASRAKVLEKGFFMHLVFVFMITLVPNLIILFLTSILPLFQLLSILMAPLQAGCLASLYLEQFEGQDPAERMQAREKLPAS